METKQNFGISEGIFSFCSSNAFLQDMGHWRSQFSKHHQCSILPNKIEDIMLNFSPVCFKSPCKLLTPRSKADSDHSDPKFLPKTRFPYLSIPTYLLVGPWDKPEQIWNKLLLLLCNQLLSLPSSCSSSSSVEHVHHHQSPVGILPTKPS